MEEKNEIEKDAVPNSPPIGEKDFIYVEELSSNESNGELKSITSIQSKKSSEGSSYADINSIDLEEPKMGDNEHGHDISELVADAQIEDFYPNFYNDEHKRSQSDIGQTDSSSNDDEDGGSIKRCPSDSYARDACVLFHGVTYLGSSTVNAPVSELELRRTISILHDNTEVSIEVILGITLHSNGDIRLIDPESRTDIASYHVTNIIFWGKGEHENREKDCLAFNVSHGKEDLSFHCHVFKCKEEDQATKILQSISQTIKKDKKRRQNDFPLRKGSAFDPNNLTFKFNATFDICEENGRGSFQSVSRDKNHFKLRKGLQRKIVLSFEQISNRKLKMERCVGLLLAAGWDVKGEDMHPLQQVFHLKDSRGGNRIVLSGHWDPTLDHYKLLNTDTDNKICMTIAADVFFDDLKEPVRFIKEVRVRVYGNNEKFWNPTKPRIMEEYTLQLKEISTEPGEKIYESESLTSNTDLLKVKALQQPVSSNNSLSSLWRHAKFSRSESTNSDIQEVFSVEQEDANEEPLLSGSGQVAQGFTEEELSNWKETLQNWKDLGKRPQNIEGLVRNGIPDALRGQVWLMMTSVVDETELINSYAYLTQKDSPEEQVILWDVTRTFPAHDFFKDAKGEGQNALYKISKAYSVYDEEVGYCQGLSFVIASFLLHVPEEQAYCLLVKIMYDYGHRDFYKDSFEVLHQAFFVLDLLMEDFMQDLYLHLRSVQVEVHMFASQWFLTLFTSKFPLSLVNHIIDIILFEGTDAIYQIALALLKDAKKDLLLQDFEGILKYFRVSLPKRYLVEAHCKGLISTAYSFKISKKRLEKYKKKYYVMKEEQDPVTRLQRDNQQLAESNLRLERDSDMLAHEIVTTQVSMQEVITDREEKVNILTKKNERLLEQLNEGEEEINRLKLEEARVKEMWRLSMKTADEAKAKQDRIIDEYKQILTRSEATKETAKRSLEEDIQSLKLIVNACEGCSSVLSNGVNSSDDSRNDSASPQKNDLSHLIGKNEQEEQLRSLEMELIQTKVALAEEKNRADELEMALHNTIPVDRPWYKKVTINNKR